MMIISQTINFRGRKMNKQTILLLIGLLMAVIGSFLIAPGMGLVSIGLIVILASWIIDKAGGTD